MSEARILAVVVTYHPGEDLDGNLAALRAQLPDVVVIDNASPASFAVERRAAAAGCRFIANAENLGMPAALNQAAEIVLAESFDWLACFDQDTRVADGAFAGLMALAESHPQAGRIGILSLSHRDRTSGRGYHKSWHTLDEGEDWRSLRTTIASGLLARVEMLHDVGLFDGRLFMDWFDHDLCLRARRGGWLVIESKRHVMEHSIGEVTATRFLGARRHHSVHSASRNYYITRNTLEICRRHMRVDPRYCSWAVVSLILARPLVVAMGKDRRAVLAALLAGVRDFARHRTGPRP
jgi:rhamnosyltransferase